MSVEVREYVTEQTQEANKIVVEKRDQAARRAKSYPRDRGYSNNHWTNSNNKRISFGGVWRK